ncbi:MULTISPECIES: DsbA family protein [unclassified Sphingomonas]|uniref:DsbA family protein n=1 Tax=unclassified Sphingomonas TaxID=196159 RepID=UPI00215098FA|nr:MULTISPECIES: DsbA family protein [unclassified Sphingomonas]MCR5870200.1 DsbA family protein [Sphingomonas sp. J344]UUX98109.1 DsbA family protein [Sphingomonas sp. J315]
MLRQFLFAALALAIPLSTAAQDEGVSESGDTRRRAAAEAIREKIRNDVLAPTIAPRGYDVTLVVFSDYQCGYCRRFSPTLDALMAEDRKVRVVYRDWPILGGGSGPAARAAIAASFQKKHLAFHRALIAQSGRIDAAKIRAAADASGVDWKRLDSDLVKRKGEIDALLARTNDYARLLGLTGTPGMMVGPYLVPGLVDLPTLKRAVAQARERR